MRLLYTVILACLVLTLLVFAFLAGHSRKAIGIPVMHLLLALLPPMVGNMILIFSTYRTLSIVGCYIYFLGMDLVMFALTRFTDAYCRFSWSWRVYVPLYIILGLDAVQLICNIYTGHAFTTEVIIAYGAPYYRLVPYLGQTFHRIVDYGILTVNLVVFFLQGLWSPRIDSERYGVIFFSMVVTTVWETIYIFSRTPMDRSMLGFGVFGILVFYFSLYYRPFRLLDRMLATVASEMPYALFFFDVNGQCIWTNIRGMELVDLEEGDYEQATDRLNRILGSTGADGENWSGSHITGSGETVQSYVMERRMLTDEKGRNIGSFLTVRDDSDEQKLLQKEIFNATHDSLTGVYNRAGYDLLLSRMDLDSTLLLLVDGDRFKQVNDSYGHEVGDRTLQKIARAISHSFRSDDSICRIGGDEFTVLMRNTGPAQYDLIRDRVKRINQELTDTSDGLPAITISVGIARGSDAADSTELYEQADRALYETKRNGRCGLTFYSDLVSA